MTKRSADEAPLRRALSRGADLTTSSGGAVVGSLIGGPVGVAVGAGLSWTAGELIDAGSDVLSRLLSTRAEARLGAVFRDIDGDVSARLVAGETPREDLREFVTPDRTAAAELIEAIFIAASQSFEERKLRYISHMWPAILFDPEISLADGHQLIAVAESLSYRQLVILAAYALPDRAGTKLRREPFPPDSSFRDHPPDSATLAALRVDLLDLFRRGLVDTDPLPRPSVLLADDSEGDDFTVWPATPAEMSPDAVTNSSRGQLLMRMMRLDTIPADDQESLVLRHLRSSDEGSSR